MTTPEIITRLMARRAEIETAKEVLRSINQYPAIEEQVEQQSKADKIFREMHIDCVDLLNARGIVRVPPVFIHELLPIFIKGRVLKSSILEDEGEQIKLTIFSTKRNPTKDSEIVVGIGGFKHNEPFLYLGRDHSSIKVFFKGSGLIDIRSANLQDARQWKEVVDAIKQQKSSPIEH